MVDSSSWISLARSGLLGLLSDIGIEAVLLDVVRAECVEQGLSGDHADATALETVMTPLAVQRTAGQSTSADLAVLDAAKREGVLVANDLTLGRRARNLGVRWLRSADLVVLGVRAGRVESQRGQRAIVALRDAGGITDALADDYLASM
ncbi:MAG TPA: hypothetical protein VED59_02650 [Acidimicrobiales bacterium]|nr:hypothetical protein [Acidimicrobiales bacterium]